MRETKRALHQRALKAFAPSPNALLARANILAHIQSAAPLVNLGVRRRTLTDPKPLMQISDIPFGITEWATIEPSEHPGESGIALWRTRTFGALRVRLVEYSPGYRADHWCEKGHILLCVSGELDTELRDGRRYHLRPGVSYQVSDAAEPHRSSSASGATLFIVD